MSERKNDSQEARAHHRQLTDRQRIDWLRLIRSDRVGPRTFRMLLNHYGSAAAALEALPELARRGGAAASARIVPEDQIRRELDSAARLGVRLVSSGEAGYPPRLATLDDAPPLLAVRGSDTTLAQPIMAMVGSRNASGAGLKMAERLACDLGRAGFAVISGLARGIDAAAHRGSLSTGTIAVLAGGHDRLYPPDHDRLLHDILSSNGAAISEMPMGHVPRGRDFPRRNRIIAGAALGVVVVEAAHRSGSLITARLAGEQGREVFAVPGSPLDPRAAGTNTLIKDGATLVTEADDIIKAVSSILTDRQDWPASEPAEISIIAEPADSDRARLAQLLGPTPLMIDDLIRLSGLSPSIVRMVLLELDLAGRIERHAGGSVSLTP